MWMSIYLRNSSLCGVWKFYSVSIYLKFSWNLGDSNTHLQDVSKQAPGKSRVLTRAKILTTNTNSKIFTFCEKRKKKNEMRMPLFLCTVKARLSARRYLLLGRGSCVNFFLYSIIFQAPHQPSQPFKFTVAESCDRIKEEFSFLQAQYHTYVRLRSPNAVFFFYLLHLSLPLILIKEKSILFTDHVSGVDCIWLL